MIYKRLHRKLKIDIYPYIPINPTAIFASLVNYNTVICKNNVIITSILSVSWIIFKNLCTVGVYSPLLILMTTENIIDTI